MHARFGVKTWLTGLCGVAVLAVACGKPAEKIKAAKAPDSEGITIDAEWKRPPGTPEEMAATMSVDELIECWRTFPSEESESDLHADYARALGLKGPASAKAVRFLAPYVLSDNLYIRQGAMAGLAGIGEAGLAHLVEALNYKRGGPGDVYIRWDAADFIAGMGAAAALAIQALGTRLVDWDENVNVKLACVGALRAIGPESILTLQHARTEYYAQGSLSVGETSVLREINGAIASLSSSVAGQETQPIMDTPSDTERAGEKPAEVPAEATTGEVEGEKEAGEQPGDDEMHADGE
jgi:hypothetical protein